MNKATRAVIKAMFGGRCAYCGCELGDRWHADHVEPVIRKIVHVQGKGFVTINESHHPERDRHDNLFPACVPCNIDKHANTLEGWRTKLEQTCDVLTRNNATYRHGIRFGLVKEARQRVVFYFEQAALAAAAPAERRG